MPTLVSEAQLNGLNDPQAADKLRAAFLEFARALKHVPREAMAESVRVSKDYLEESLFRLHTLSASVVAASLGWQGVGDTVRVEVKQDAPDSIAVRVFGLAASGDGESLFAEITQSMGPATATGGLTCNFSLHLTSIGAQPLWDFGDVVAAEATETKAEPRVEAEGN